MIQTMKANLAQLIESTKGKFVTLRFKKKDGTIRTINAKDKYQRLLHGGDNKVRLAGYESAVNRNKESWFCAKDDRVLEFKCGAIHEKF